MNKEDYIERHTSAQPALLAELQRDTWLHKLYPRMCTDAVTGRFLAMLSTMRRPQTILEIGTFTGYSALCLSEGLAPGGKLHTVEIDDEAEEMIRRYFNRSPRRDDLILHIGDALDIVPLLELQQWDMVYIDGNKRNYPDYLDMVLPRMSPGGIIIADNTLWSGKVDDPDANDAQTLGLRRFNDMACRLPDYTTVMIDIGDGLTLMRRND